MNPVINLAHAASNRATLTSAATWQRLALAAITLSLKTISFLCFGLVATCATLFFAGTALGVFLSGAILIVRFMTGL